VESTFFIWSVQIAVTLQVWDINITRLSAYRSLQQTKKTMRRCSNTPALQKHPSCT